MKPIHIISDRVEVRIYLDCHWKEIKTRLKKRNSKNKYYSQKMNILNYIMTNDYVSFTPEMYNEAWFITYINDI